MTAHTADGTLDLTVTGSPSVDPPAGRSGRFDLGIRGGRKVAAAAPAGRRADGDDGSMGTA